MKWLSNWRALSTTKDLIARYPGGIEIATSRSSKGLLYATGTLAHPDIAAEFERWCQKRPGTYACLVWAEGTDIFKIRMTPNPSGMLKTMQDGSPVKLTISRAEPCKNPKDLREAKKILHEAFKDYHSHAEWFKVEPEQALALFDRTVANWAIASPKVH